MIKRIKIRSVSDINTSFRAYPFDIFLGSEISEIKGICIAIENLKQSLSTDFFPVFVVNVDLSMNNTIPVINYQGRIITPQPNTYRSNRTMLYQTLNRNIKYLAKPLVVPKGSFLRTVVQEIPAYGGTTSYDVVLYIDYRK